MYTTYFVGAYLVASLAYFYYIDLPVNPDDQATAPLWTRQSNLKWKTDYSLKKQKSPYVPGVPIPQLDVTWGPYN
jgi:hypothetical protein